MSNPLNFFKLTVDCEHMDGLSVRIDEAWKIILRQYPANVEGRVKADYEIWETADHLHRAYTYEFTYKSNPMKRIAIEIKVGPTVPANVRYAAVWIKLKTRYPFFIDGKTLEDFRAEEIASQTISSLETLYTWQFTLLKAVSKPSSPNPKYNLEIFK